VVSGRIARHFALKHIPSSFNLRDKLRLWNESKHNSTLFCGLRPFHCLDNSLPVPLLEKRSNSRKNKASLAKVESKHSKNALKAWLF
jgi:hypothetical protein